MADDWFVPDAPQGPPAKAGADDWAVPREADDVSAGMVLRGIPVLGAYIPQAEAAIRAAAHPLDRRWASRGRSWSERYAANLPKRQARYAEVEKEQPIASTAAQIARRCAGTGPSGGDGAGRPCAAAASRHARAKGRGLGGLRGWHYRLRMPWHAGRT